MSTDAKGPTEATQRALAEAAQNLPAENDDVANAERGFVGGPDSLVIKDEKGNTVWDTDCYGFLREDGDVPDTVHPSLWRHARSTPGRASTRSPTASTRCAATTSPT